MYQMMWHIKKKRKKERTGIVVKFDGHFGGLLCGDMYIPLYFASYGTAFSSCTSMELCFAKICLAFHGLH